MQLPASLLEIKAWKAYKGQFPEINGEHRIILVYQDGDIFYRFCVTSQIDKAKLRTKYDKGSLVEIKPDEWDALTTNSCIECSKNNFKPISKSILVQMYQNGELKVLGEVPETIKTKIIHAICASKTYNDTEKSFILPLKHSRYFIKYRFNLYDYPNNCPRR